MTPRGAGGYARAIERAWSALLERPVVFSPQDWNRVAEWHARGIPLAVVREALEEAAARARKRGRTGPARLAAIGPAVEESWSAIMDGRSAAVEPPTAANRPVETPARWAALIRQGGPLGEYLHGVSLALDEGTLSPESAAAGIDERLPALVPRELLRKIEDDVDARLRGFAGRLGPAALARTRRRALLDGLRRATGVGRLEWDS